jgi:putative copper export protein
MEWIIARWITFAATMLALGSAAVGVILIPRHTNPLPDRARLLRHTARVGWWACVALIAASMLRLLDQMLALRSPGDPLVSGLSSLLFATTWGTGFLWQMNAASLSLLVFLWLASGDRARGVWSLSMLVTSGLAWTPALQGHAIGTEEFTVAAVIADTAHVLGAGLWLGSIAVIGWLGSRATARAMPISESRIRADSTLRALVPLVPPLALTGATMLIASGITSTVLHLRSLSDLWTEAWGRFVLIKSVLIFVISALGARNWRRLGRQMDDARGVEALRTALVTELIVSALLLLVTALLVVTPLPGE